MITLTQYWMGREEEYSDDMSTQIHDNAVDLLNRVNSLLKTYCDDKGLSEPQLSSGWRPRAINETILTASKNSKHITAQAIDIADSNRNLINWCVENIYALEQEGLYLESPDNTPTWCHLQSVAPKSGHRIFKA